MRNDGEPAVRASGLKSRLAAGDVVLGCLLGESAPWMVEMLGYAGYDFVVIDLEHEPFNEETVPHLLRAADAVGLSAIARMPCSARMLPMLSVGVHGIQVPHLETREQAEEAVAMVRFAPEGRRTYYATARFARYGFGIDERELLRSVNEELLLIGMIESVTAVENLDELLSVEGVDAFHVGPLDLAQSMDFPSGERLEEVITDIVRRCLAAGKYVTVGVVAPHDPDVVDRRLAQGVQLLTVGSSSLMAHAISTMHATISERLVRAGMTGRPGAVVARNAYLSTGSSSNQDRA